MSPPVAETDEERLVAWMVAYQGGDLAAFEALYAALAEDLRAYVARALRDRGGAHDLVQETFLEMHRSRRTYSPPLPVRPWVFGIARNVLARSRRAARHPAGAQVVLDGSAEGRARQAPSIDAFDVEHALAALPASTREPWLLHHGHGWSFQAIAERLGLTVVAAKLRSSRASRALRAALGIDRRGRR